MAIQVIKNMHTGGLLLSLLGTHTIQIIWYRTLWLDGRNISLKDACCCRRFPTGIQRIKFFVFLGPLKSEIIYGIRNCIYTLEELPREQITREFENVCR